MSVLYLLTEGVKAKLQAERIVLVKQKEIIWSVPLAEVESLVVSRNAQVSTQAIHAIILQGGHIFYVDGSGKVYGSMGNEQVSLKHLRIQLKKFEDPRFQLQFAKEVIEKKIRAQRNLLYSYSKSNTSPELKKALLELDGILKRVKTGKKVDMIRGLEGVAAQKYFDMFRVLITANGFIWNGRYKHPAPDPVNALLSYSYHFLEREVRIAIAAFGADVRIGFLHSSDGRKDSLVYDLMEMFRASISDRLVLKVINKKRIKPEHFINYKGKNVLTGEGNRKWCEYYEKFMLKELSGLNGMTPRAWIRKDIRSFLKEKVFNEKENTINSDNDIIA